jgi:hypothetical protein
MHQWLDLVVVDRAEQVTALGAVEHKVEVLGVLERVREPDKERVVGDAGEHIPLEHHGERLAEGLEGGAYCSAQRSQKRPPATSRPKTKKPAVTTRATAGSISFWAPFQA